MASSTLVPSVGSLFLALTATLLVLHIVHGVVTLHFVDNTGHLVRSRQVYESGRGGLAGPYRDGLIALAGATFLLGTLWVGLCAFLFSQNRKNVRVTPAWSSDAKTALLVVLGATITSMVVGGLNLYLVENFQDMDDVAFRPEAPEELSDYQLRGPYGTAMFFLSVLTLVLGGTAALASWRFVLQGNAPWAEWTDRRSSRQHHQILHSNI